MRSCRFCSAEAGAGSPRAPRSLRQLRNLMMLGYAEPRAPVLRKRLLRFLAGMLAYWQSHCCVRMVNYNMSAYSAALWEGLTAPVSGGDFGLSAVNKQRYSGRVFQTRRGGQILGDTVRANMQGTRDVPRMHVVPVDYAEVERRGNGRKQGGGENRPRLRNLALERHLSRPRPRTLLNAMHWPEMEQLRPLQPCATCEGASAAAARPHTVA